MVFLKYFLTIEKKTNERKKKRINKKINKFKYKKKVK